MAIINRLLDFYDGDGDGDGDGSTINVSPWASPLARLGASYATPLTTDSDAG